MPQASSSRLSRKKQKNYNSEESSDSRAEANTDEEPFHAPRVAQWIDEEELEDGLSDIQSEKQDSAKVSLFLSQL